MRCLSIQQPWAWLIVHGYKDVENRDWATNVRGEFAVHAGKKYDLDGERWVRTAFPEIPLPPRDALPMGGLVGVARLVDCVSSHPSRWFFGRLGFVLREARPVPLHPCKGALGFFAVDYTPPKDTLKAADVIGMAAKLEARTARTAEWKAHPARADLIPLVAAPESPDSRPSDGHPKP